VRQKQQSDATSVGDTSKPLDSLIEKIYAELREVARWHKRGERAGLTLQTTALVHEAYLRLAESGSELSLRDRRHLKAVTSRVIRHVLVDYSRRSAAAKRDPNSAHPGLIEETLIEPMLDVNVVDLDTALHRLARHSPRMERVVECRFFGGLSVEETAKALDMSESTVARDWQKARAYLLHYLDDRIISPKD
jgi:RNA polymerase sigma factor (TIGR02999 family)